MPRVIPEYKTDADHSSKIDTNIGIIKYKNTKKLQEIFDRNWTDSGYTETNGISDPFYLRSSLLDSIDLHSSTSSNKKERNREDDKQIILRRTKQIDKTNSITKSTKSIISDNKRRSNKKLKFAILNGHVKLGAFLSLNNWVNREFIPSNANEYDLVLVMNYPGSDFWTMLKDRTIVNCFPRIMSQCSEGLDKKPCTTEWVFSDLASPYTAIVKKIQDLEYLYFSHDYFIMACINVLKFVVLHKKVLYSLGQGQGTIPLWILTYAIVNCNLFSRNEGKYQSYQSSRKKLAFKGNGDDHQWKPSDLTERDYRFLNYHYSLLQGTNTFENLNVNDQIWEVILHSAQLKLQELEPNFKHNIGELNGYPNKNTSGKSSIHLETWILKTHSSKGFGIRKFQKLESLNTEIKANEYHCDYYVIQKFITNQFLIDGKEFKIINFIIIVNIKPLQCIPIKHYYFIINNKQHKQYVYDLEWEQILWSLQEFEEYLLSIKKKGAWTNQIQPKILECIEHTCLVNRRFLEPRNNSFEIVRTTFKVDGDFNPWLINIKSNYKYDQCSASEHIMRQVYGIIEKKNEKQN